MKKKILITAFALATVFSGITAFESYSGANEAAASVVLGAHNKGDSGQCTGVGDNCIELPIQQ